MPLIGLAGESDTFAFRPNDDAALAFYDIQALKSRSYATAAGPQATLAMDPQGPAYRIRTALLMHASGFMVIRLTIAGVDQDDESAVTLEDCRRLERLPWTGQAFSWTAFGHSFTGSLRSCMNLHFFVVHERLMNREIDPAELAAEAEDSPTGNARIQRMCRDGEISHPFPVSFGTHIEILDDRKPASESRRIRSLTTMGLDSVVADQTTLAGALVGEDGARAWYLLENQSIVFSDAQSEGFNGILDMDRLALLEFLTLRRGALRSVQRDTQRILVAGADVSRRRIDEWRLLLATTTDDYVLHDRLAPILIPVVRHMATCDLVRDQQLLEQQVRGNIESFQARIDLASQSVSTLIGALFAVVAVVIGFSSVLKAAAAGFYDTTVSGLADDQPWLNSLIDVGVSVGAFAMTWLLIRRAGERLPPLRPYTSVPKVRRPGTR